MLPVPRFVLPALAALAATPVAAFDLDQPIDCALDQTCYIQQYVDHDPGPGAQDFTCAGLSYDGHKGTDFGLPSLQDMQAGVDVLAAAPGTVTALRDGMRDAPYTPDRAAEIDGKDCGNGVVIRHGDGWETQYCHMKQGSIIVTKGQDIKAGDVLGQVGLSGRTQFPHLHLSVRQNGQVIDPFDADGSPRCVDTGPDDSLWASDIAYTPGAILNLGFSDHVPDYADVKAGSAAAPDMPVNGPALVLWGFAFGGRTGDALHLTITGPDGEVIDHRAQLDKAQAQFFRAAGKKTPQGGWPKGVYSGTAQLIRQGDVIDRAVTQIQLD